MLKKVNFDQFNRENSPSFDNFCRKIQIEYFSRICILKMDFVIESYF